VFLSEAVDVAIYEVGVGGAWDSTNVVEQPAVTGITTLGIDHVAVLGDTLAKIAWHKAGIFKTGVPAFSVEQAPEGTEVLRERAVEKGVDLHIVGVDPFVSRLEVVPNVDYQRRNISLAIALVVAAGERLGLTDLHPDALPDVLKDGIEQTVWREDARPKPTVQENGILMGRIHWIASKLLRNGLLSRLRIQVSLVSSSSINSRDQKRRVCSCVCTKPCSATVVFSSTM
jgi:hypothetical protein